MKTIRMKIDPSIPAALRPGRIDRLRVDTTTEREIARQQLADDKDALQDAARFALRVRQRLGLSQSQFSRHINVPIETIRNWEQGKRYPTGAAKALLRVLDREPEAALRALGER